ncbi:24659_t:CDS:2, partial [Gigaspora margarita]
ETINPNTIQKTNIDNKYLVPSTNENNNTNYIVNSEISVCSCPVGMSEPEVLDKESNKIIETNNFNFISFLENIRSDYQNTDQLLQTVLDKFKDCYNLAKSKFVLWLFSFLYDINCNMDPMVYIKSSAHICVQVESIK